MQKSHYTHISWDKSKETALLDHALMTVVYQSVASWLLTSRAWKQQFPLLPHCFVHSFWYSEIDCFCAWRFSLTVMNVQIMSRSGPLLWYEAVWHQCTVLYSASLAFHRLATALLQSKNPRPNEKSQGWTQTNNAGSQDLKPWANKLLHRMGFRSKQISCSLVDLVLLTAMNDNTSLLVFYLESTSSISNGGQKGLYMYMALQCPLRCHSLKQSRASSYIVSAWPWLADHPQMLQAGPSLSLVLKRWGGLGHR